MPKYRMTGMQKSLPKSVDEYIAAQSEAVRQKLEQVRAAIRKAVPEAVECIGYRMPGYQLHGKPMLYFAGFKEHYSLFAASGTFFAALEDELRGYDLRKGNGPFPTHQTGSGEAHQPDRETACGWHGRHGAKTSVRPRARKEQVGTVGHRLASHREGVSGNTVICQKAFLASVRIADD